jgi:hypothetical protein
MIKNSPIEAHPDAISVIIVNYNSGALLTRCIQSVLASDISVKVIVIDNNSQDDSLIKASTAYENDDRLIILRNSVNAGFAHASNQAIHQATGKYWLYLNPDSIIQPDTISNMCQLMENNPDAAMAGPLIVNADGSEQRGCRRTIPTPWRSFIRAFGLSRFCSKKSALFKDFLMHTEPLPEAATDVEAISGAFMLVRKQAIDEVGLMDDGYFLHCEDLDWCMRFHEKDWRILFDPNIVIRHDKGGCSQGQPIFVLWHMHKGMIRFYKKFFKTKYPGVLMWLVSIAVWMRFSILALVHFIKNSLTRFNFVKTKTHALKHS